MEARIVVGHIWFFLSVRILRALLLFGFISDRIFLNKEILEILLLVRDDDEVAVYKMFMKNLKESGQTDAAGLVMLALISPACATENLTTHKKFSASRTVAAYIIGH
jgi:regulatory protein YycI of two-component signal transduction system YycFG